MKLAKITPLILALTLGFTTGCGPGFQPGSPGATSTEGGSGNPGGGGTGGGGSGGGGTGGENPGWQDVRFDGAIDGAPYDGIQSITLNKKNKMLIVRLPMLANPFLGGIVGAEFPFKGLKNAKLVIETMPNGTSLVILHIPLEFVVRGVNLDLPPGKLPNGDPLPRIPGGELPSLAVQLTGNNNGNVKATIYLGPAVVGLFVTLPFDPTISFTLPIRNEEKTRILGYLVTIPKKGGFDGGFFVSAMLPSDLARVIDDLL